MGKASINNTLLSELGYPLRGVVLVLWVWFSFRRDQRNAPQPGERADTVLWAYVT